MDTKTAYTRTFLMLKDQPIHEESIKAAYFSWWQNVRESYQARSLRHTKLGYEWVKDLDIKTYENIFTDWTIYKARDKNEPWVTYGKLNIFKLRS